MQRMSRTGNTYYIFDEDGTGKTFNGMGSYTGDTKLVSVCFSLKSVMDVQVLSILGIPGSKVCDVYFDGYAGIANCDCKELINKARKLPNLLTVPLRIPVDESEGVLQVLFVTRVGSYTAKYFESLLGINRWRNAK